MNVDTTRGYIKKPKRRKGYSIERCYCECGCKKGYWHYVPIVPKPKVTTSGNINGTWSVTINNIRDENLYDVEVAVLKIFGRTKKKLK